MPDVRWGEYKRSHGNSRAAREARSRSTQAPRRAAGVVIAIISHHAAGWPAAHLQGTRREGRGEKSAGQRTGQDQTADYCARPSRPSRPKRVSPAWSVRAAQGKANGEGKSARARLFIARACAALKATPPPAAHSRPRENSAATGRGGVSRAGPAPPRTEKQVARRAEEARGEGGRGRGHRPLPALLCTSRGSPN